MAETGPTSTEARQRPPPRREAPQPRPFHPLLGGLTMMVLTVGGLIVLSPVKATDPTPPAPTG